MSGDTDKDFQSLTADLTPEIALLERKPSGESRFNLLEG
jgi:hypothetical protein